MCNFQIPKLVGLFALLASFDCLSASAATPEGNSQNSADRTEAAKDISLNIVDSNGHPARNVELLSAMIRMRNLVNVNADWRFPMLTKADNDGKVVLSSDALGDWDGVVRTADGELIGIASLPPAALPQGTVIVNLLPRCWVRGTIQCDQKQQLGKPVGWTNAMLTRDGRVIAQCSSFSGDFELPIPPGKYVLRVYGEDLHTKLVDITVPEGVADFILPPIKLNGSNLISLEGHAAPELIGVVGWKNGSTKLSDLRGKVVLLDFWGYWCGPCVAQMPVLIALHEKYHDEGLAIVGVHLDNLGDIQTAAQLDERLNKIRGEQWHGKDVPFPVALASGKFVEPTNGDEPTRGGPAEQYGVLGYPTTIVIDRAGKVRGQFYPGTKDAEAQLEALLAKEN